MGLLGGWCAPGAASMQRAGPRACFGASGRFGILALARVCGRGTRVYRRPSQLFEFFADRFVDPDSDSFFVEGLGVQHALDAGCTFEHALHSPGGRLAVACEVLHFVPGEVPAGVAGQSWQWASYPESRVRLSNRIGLGRSGERLSHHPLLLCDFPSCP